MEPAKRTRSPAPDEAGPSNWHTKRPRASPELPDTPGSLAGVNESGTQSQRQAASSRGVTEGEGPGNWQRSRPTQAGVAASGKEVGAAPNRGLAHTILRRPCAPHPHLSTFNPATFHLPPGMQRGSAGQICRMQLVNFMCHSHFTMEFGPHFSVVQGSNGTGKSAIVQALQCCLGVRAGQTGRFRRAADFVQTTKRHASAAVTLWNEGPDAWHPQALGPQLTLERQLRQSGHNPCTGAPTFSSEFIIRDAAGRKVGGRIDGSAFRVLLQGYVGIQEAWHHPCAPPRARKPASRLQAMLVGPTLVAVAVLCCHHMPVVDTPRRWCRYSLGSPTWRLPWTR